MTDRALARLLYSATPFALPLTTRFRGVDSREGVLLHGPSGWGEFLPFGEYSDEACALWLANAIEAAYGRWPDQKRSHIPVNAIVPAVDPNTAASMAYRAYVGDGCTTVKVKVAERGQTLDDDVARVDAVRSALLAASVQDPKIRVDANGAWTVPEAVVAIRELEQVARGLEYVEQPCRTLAELRDVRRRVSVPVAADESIRLAGDPIAAVQLGAVDLVVIKVQPTGGVNLALQVCEAAKVPVVVSGAMDSSVGLAAPLALAAALDQLPHACGVGTGALLAQDLVKEPVRPRGGMIAARRLDPDPVHLREANQRLTPERQAFWRARLERAWHAGASALAGSLIAPDPN